MRGRPLHYATIIGGIKFLWVVAKWKTQKFVPLTLWHHTCVFSGSGVEKVWKCEPCMLEKWWGRGGGGT